ncbi:hypothetical protein lerEdw1_017002 [Lerista edwardsae]|nr:hypothetical protein lerEdw1_017002 [Lerista edwardsae]
MDTSFHSMTPRDHIRKMSILGEQGALEDKHLYRLASGVAAGELRQRQEMIMRNQMMAVNPQLMGAGQQRIQTIPSQFEPRFVERMEMEMNAIFQQKEIEKAHRLGLEGPFLYHGIPASPVAFRGRHRVPEGHLPSDLYVHRTSLDELHGNSMLMAASPYPPVGSLQRERGRRPGRRAGSHKAPDCNGNSTKTQAEEKGLDPDATTAYEEKEDKKEAEAEMLSKHEPNKVHAEPLVAAAKHGKDYEHGQRKNSGNHEMPSEANSCSNGNEKEPNNSCTAFEEKYVYPSAFPFSALPYGFSVPTNPLLPTGTSSLILNGEDISSIEDIRKWTVEDVYTFIISLPGCADYAQIFKDHAIDGETLPLLTEEHLLDTMGLKLGPALKIRCQDGLIVQKRKDQILVPIRLLNNALPVLDPNVSRRLGSMFYMMNFPLSVPASSGTGKPSDPPPDIASPLHCNASGDALGSPCSQDPEMSKTVEQIVAESRENASDIAGAPTDFSVVNYQKN